VSRHTKVGRDGRFGVQKIWDVAIAYASSAPALRGWRMFSGLTLTAGGPRVSRLFGAALVAWGAILWLAKSFRDEAAVRAVLIATCVAEAISLVFVVQATLAGTLNAMGWVAVLIYLFGASGCAYFLTRSKQLAAG
jgi:hypothetical protein